MTENELSSDATFLEFLVLCKKVSTMNVHATWENKALLYTRVVEFH